MSRQTLSALQPAPDAPASAWAARITACWQASVKAILEVGRLLTAAKATIPFGEFSAMIESDLPFTPRTAEMLMAIARDPRITNPKHVSLLPPHWGTLYELTKLTDEQFEKGIETKTINPELERKRAIDAARAIAPSRVEPSDSLDYFPTPPWATRALIEQVFPVARVKPHGIAIEPACGEGHIAEVLAEYFDHVDATDVFDYGYGGIADYLTATIPRDYADWIITNPPFLKKTEPFVMRSLDLARVGVAMFVRMQWLETKGRYERIFRDQPPTVIAFFAERVPLCKGEWKPDGDTATAYVWLVWIKNRKPQAPFWIPPDCREKLTRPDDAERFTTHPVTKKEYALRVADDGAVTDFDTGEIIESKSTEGPHSSSEASSGVVPQDEAPHAGIGSETLAGCEGRSESEDRSANAPLDSDNLDIPGFLRRGSAECAVRS